MALGIAGLVLLAGLIPAASAKGLQKKIDSFEDPDPDQTCAGVYRYACAEKDRNCTHVWIDDDTNANHSDRRSNEIARSCTV